MDSTALQAEANALLVRCGLRDEAGKVGLEFVPADLSQQLGINSFAIRSIALAKVARYTEWITAGVRSEVIVYAFSDPFRYSTLMRVDRRPALPLDAAVELKDVSLARIATLYPLDELAS